MATRADLRPEPTPAAAMAPPPAAKAPKAAAKPKPKPAAPPKPKPAPPPPPPPPPEPPPAPEPPPVAEPEPATTEAAEDARLQAESAVPKGPSFESLLEQAVAPTRGKPAAPKRSRLRRVAAAFGWLLLVAVVAGGGAAYYLRDTLMESYPETKPVFAFFGIELPPPGDGLRLTNVTSARSTVDGTPALVIDGKVTNTTDGIRAVPPMRGSLRDSKDQELQVWTFAAESAKLNPGETTTFHTEVKQPPAQATGLSISFIASP